MRNFFITEHATDYFFFFHGLNVFFNDILYEFQLILRGNKKMDLISELVSRSFEYGHGRRYLTPRSEIKPKTKIFRTETSESFIFTSGEMQNLTVSRAKDKDGPFNTVAPLTKLMFWKW